jgi:hypothetical protein
VDDASLNSTCLPFPLHVPRLATLFVSVVDSANVTNADEEADAFLERSRWTRGEDTDLNIGCAPDVAGEERFEFFRLILFS